MTRLPALLALAFAACSVDASVGHLIHPDDLDAAPPDPDATPDAADPVTPHSLLYAEGAGGIVFEGDDLVITTSTQYGEYSLLRIAPDGSTQVLVPGLVGGELVEDDTHYFTLEGYLLEGGGSGPVIAIDKTTLATTALAPGVPGDSARWALALDDDWVYFDEHGDGVTGTGRLARVAKTGGATHVMFAGLRDPKEIAIDDDYAYVADDNDAEEGAGTIVAVPKNAACAAFELVSGLNRPHGVLVVGDWLYFTERGNLLTDGTIDRVARPTTACATAPASTPEVLVTGLGHPSYLTAHGDDIYWTAYFSGLQRAPLDGGPAETLLGCLGDNEPLGDPHWPQGCGAIGIHDETVYYAARRPDDTMPDDGFLWQLGALYAVPIP